MAEMTKEEYDALDELWTKNTPKVGPTGSGFISQREGRLMGLDRLSVNYLMTESKATHKSPVEIIGSLIRKDILQRQASLMQG
jgi:hypothetical protein